jgi:uncharacterized membrane protein YphA (DoxX/SURF4 family)
MVEAASAVMPSPGYRRYIRLALLVGRIALGAIFLYAAYAKLHYAGAWHFSDYHYLFAFGINSYQMLSPDHALMLARLLPWMEVALGVLLIAGIGLRWVGSLTTALLVVFMFALARAAMLRLEINCGCFGNQSTTPAKELILDSGLLLVALGVTAGAFLSARGDGRSPA